MAQEVEGDSLGEEYKGYVFKITGGNDKQGFPMKQGVLTNTRVRLLLREGATCYRQRRDGERKRKSVRGCIVGSDLSVIHLVIVKKGDSELPGLTDNYVPRRLGPKRASKIRKLFNLSKEDDVRKYVVRRELPAKEGKKAHSKAPKIQRLVTPERIHRKKRLIRQNKERHEKAKSDAAEYAKLVAQRHAERKTKLNSQRTSQRLSEKKTAELVQKLEKKTASPAVEKKAEKKPAAAAAAEKKPAAKKSAEGKKAKKETKPAPAK